MIDPSAAYPLTTGQRRRLELTLVRLAEEAREIAGLVEQEADSEREAGALLAELERVRTEALRLARELGLSLGREPVDWRRRVQAWAALAWADVLDSGPGPLRGYGPVDPRTAELLGPHIEKLATSILAVGARARPDAEKARVPGDGSSEPGV